jgi:hypothetical protein
MWTFLPLAIMALGLLVPSGVWADPQTHASDCSAYTCDLPRSGQECYQIDTDTLYVCDSDGPSWVLVAAAIWVKQEFALNAIDLSPGASGATAEDLNNYPGFAYSINDDMIMSFELPYDMNTSEDLKVEIYWYIDEARDGTNQEVQWLGTWAATPSDATEALDAPTHSGTIDFGDQTIPVAAKHLTEISGTVAAASLADKDFVSLNMKRVALDGGNNPTAEPVIVQIEIEYTKNKLGEAI